MTNEIAKILFIPEVFFETAEGRSGIAGIRLAQETQIIELIIQNIEKSSLATKTKEKIYEIGICK